MGFKLDDAFPPTLAASERELIKARRTAAGITPAELPAADKPSTHAEGAWGLALSGGGIRSATFCLGVLQSLARASKLSRFDYLSTVSGGGFAGGYLGAAITRHGLKETEKALSDDCSPTMRWFRENGRYLAPNGTVDLWTAAATMLRNLLSLHVVLVSALMAVMLALQGARWFLLVYASDFYGKFEPRPGASFFIPSPLLLVSLLPVVGVFIPAAWAYWLTQRRSQRVIAAFTGAWFTVVGAVWFFVDLWPQQGISRLHLMLMIALGGIAFTAITFWALACLLLQVRTKLLSAPSIIAAILLALCGFGGFTAWHWYCTDRQPGNTTLLIFGIATLITGYLLTQAYEAESLREFRRQLRAGLARICTLALIVSCGLLLLALGDSLAQSLFQYQFRMQKGLSGYGSLVAAIFVGVTAALPWIQKVTSLLGSKFKVTMGVIAPIAATLLGTVYLVSLSTIAYWVRLGDQQIGQAGSVDWVVIWCLVLGGTVVLVGRLFGFVNTSSLQDFYAARLTRAYVGASNPERIGGPALDQWFTPGNPPKVEDTTKRHHGTPVTESLPTDDILFYQYAPHRNGGPLHLINVTLNETVSGKSHVETQDRRGLPLAFGPAGLSLGVRHHARWKQTLGRGTTESQFPSESGGPRTQVENAGPRAAGRKIFQIWPEDAKDHPIAPESLSLGYLMGISGAAFSTGLGIRTSMALSTLAGLFNVRLGYWWDSGVAPGKREGEASRTFPQMIGRFLAWLLPVHVALMDELLARFHGPARKRWYLTDGGHYENTAAYELLRRQLPVIVVCDCGADPGYGMGDIGSLLRLAHADFGAEVRFLDGAERDKLVEGVRPLVGTLPELAPAKKWHGDCTVSVKHIAIARVSYKDSTRTSILIVLKPSLSSTLPMELLEYHLRQRTFPQQSTTDQFFDEAQWQSYRLLGNQIGALAAQLLTKASLDSLAGAEPAPAG